jgi:hypothetical protein
VRVWPSVKGLLEIEVLQSKEGKTLGTGLKPESQLSNIYKFSCCLTESTLSLYCKDQSVNAA